MAAAEPPRREKLQIPCSSLDSQSPLAEEAVIVNLINKKRAETVLNEDGYLDIQRRVLRENNSEGSKLALYKAAAIFHDDDDAQLLQQALAMSMHEGASGAAAVVDAATAEAAADDQDLALQLFKCLSRTHRGQSDMSKVFEDRSFVTSILNTLPGVDPNDPSVKDLLAYFAWPRRVRKWCLHLCLHLQIPLCSSLGERLMSPISVPLMREAPSVLQA
ncbi:hypothetical protein ZWY2020_057354 [Hordeum vulgare]|nr:hypothetical protein ZWY2020_057354 [Hordeum vulgare]